VREVWALAAKDLRLLVRDRGGVFFTFFFPVLFAVFFGTVFGGGGGQRGATRIALVDLDGSPRAIALAGALDAEARIEVVPLDSEDEAVQAVRRGRHAAVVVIPPGFGEASLLRGEPLELRLGVDPSRHAEAGLIRGLVTAKAFEQLGSLFTDVDAARDAARDAIASLETADINPAQRLVLGAFFRSFDTFLDEGDKTGVFERDTATDAPAFNPVNIEALDLTADTTGRPATAYAVSFPQGIVWGVMGCAAGFGISLVTERSRGTLTRLRTAPIPPGRILLGKGLACFLTTIGVAAMLLAIAALIFGVRPGSAVLLAAAVGAIAVGFVGVMMLLSTLGRTEAAAGGIGWAVLLVFAMIGGGMVPLMAMPAWMGPLSHASPVKWAILALEGAIWRGFTPAEMAVPSAVLVGVGVAGFAVGSRVFDAGEG
jgi:ABC-2 type transport system permease protein